MSSKYCSNISLSHQKNTYYFYLATEAPDHVYVLTRYYKHTRTQYRGPRTTD